MSILSRKMGITFEGIYLQVSNKYHLVPCDENNHLIPNLNGMCSVQIKYKWKTPFLLKMAIKGHAKGHIPLVGFLRTFDML